MKPVNMRKDQVICECAECAETVIITPYLAKDEYDADYACYECGLVVCESCYGNFETLNYGEDDNQLVCGPCYDASVARVEKSKAKATEADTGSGASPCWVACTDKLPPKAGAYLGWDGVAYKVCWLEYKFGPDLDWGETCRCSHWTYLPQPPSFVKETP